MFKSVVFPEPLCPDKTISDVEGNESEIFFRATVVFPLFR
jgi:hypothetical protein